MKGYKGFDKDLKCRGFQYEVGKTYECEGKITLCKNGFHFCEDPKNIRGYYADLTACRYCEVEASGEIINGDGKCVCSKITIVREIPLQEFLALVNEGSRNTGWMNDGDWNKGDCNKGDCNKGNDNEGDCNKGNDNEGDWNKGDCNKGDDNEGTCNEGNCNKGDWNKGDCNKGDYNKGDCNEGNGNIGLCNRGNDTCGLFNTDGGCVIFNKYTPTKHTKIEKMKGYSLLAECIFEKKLPEEEELAEIRKLPNFDEKVMNELIFGKGDKK
jgi:hypothetical protein